MARFAPIPGTKMYVQLENAGLLSANSVDWTMESNQRFDSNYTHAFSDSEFRRLMHDVAEFIEHHNASNSALMGQKDRRLK